MLNFIKNIPCYIFSTLGTAFEYIAKAILSISVICFSLSVTLHKLLRTPIGLKLIEIENTTQAIVKMYTDFAASMAAGEKAQQSEDNRLANIINSNVVQLGKKKDEPKS